MKLIHGSRADLFAVVSLVTVLVLASLARADDWTEHDAATTLSELKWRITIINGMEKDVWAKYDALKAARIHLEARYAKQLADGIVHSDDDKLLIVMMVVDAKEKYDLGGDQWGKGLGRCLSAGIHRTAASNHFANGAWGDCVTSSLAGWIECDLAVERFASADWHLKDGTDSVGIAHCVMDAY